MSLTKQDKQDVQEIVDNAVSDLADIIGTFATNVDNRFEQVDKRFDQMDKRFDKLENRVGNLEGRVGSLESGQRESSRKLANLEEGVKNIDNRLEAIENDVKEIYLLLNKKQDRVVSVKGLKGKDLEEYIVSTYSNIVQIAKEANIKLPA